MNPGGASPDPDARNEGQRALLRAQPWGRISKQLTAIAFKRIRGRSMSDAKDLAQAAIADAYESVESGGWDPERAPLISFLVARVISSSGNERRRKRNACEVWLDEEGEEDAEIGKHEKHLGADEPPADDALHRLRFASTFHARLLAQLAGDALALELVGFMREGLSTPEDLAAATERPIGEIRDARRRLRYRANEITKELSAGARPWSVGSAGDEVTQ